MTLLTYVSTTGCTGLNNENYQNALLLALYVKKTTADNFLAQNTNMAKMYRRHFTNGIEG